jgi:hypothetical protein
MQHSSSDVNTSVGVTGSGTPGSSWLTSVSERRAQSQNGSGSITVTEAFATMLSDIQITDTERDEASKQQIRLRERLAGLLSLKSPGTFLTGSYRRNTQKRPLDDIDLFVVLDEGVYVDTIHKDALGATRAINTVEIALRLAYPYTEVRRHDRGVQIAFVGTGIGFDVIPAYQTSVDEFWIPDETRGCWIQTNPKEQQCLVSDANQNRCGEMLVPEIKLLKTWNDESGRRLKGFHLEALAFHALHHAPECHQEGIAWLFQSLANSVRYGTPDIWPLGEPADGYLSEAQRTAAAGALRAAATAAQSAILAEQQGRTEEAHAIWFSLFGGFYPQQGTGRRSASDVRPVAGFAAVAAIRSGQRTSASSSGMIPAAAGFLSARASTSHGGQVENDDLTAADRRVGREPVQAPSRGQEERLEREIELALAQFPGLVRVDVADAAADPSMWPVTVQNAATLHAVLVGDQRSNLGKRHRILVAIPVGAPAIESRIYPLRHHVKRVPTADGQFRPFRQYLHLWPDGSMCTHALRDHWDGRLISLLIYAADWLVRQDFYQLTGVWIGRQIGRGGHLMINGRRADQTIARHAHQRRTRRAVR